MHASGSISCFSKANLQIMSAFQRAFRIASTKPIIQKNVKRGGVGLYCKDSLASIQRLDLVTLPECVVSEIQLNKKRYFSALIYRSPSQVQTEFNQFTINFN